MSKPFIEGYEVQPTGAIKQVAPQPFRYDAAYVNAYQAHGAEKLRNMAYLRLGWLLGNIVSFRTQHKERLLDVGYGSGAFLQAAHDSGFFECYGTDVAGLPPPEGVTFVAPDEWQKQKWDVVTFFDVLEHIENHDFLGELKADVIVITVPHCKVAFPGDANNADREWFRNWKHRKPNEHIWHFDANSLAGHMDNYGYLTFDHGHPHFEDAIRKGSEPENILTMLFYKASSI